MAVIPQIGSGAYLPYIKSSLNGTKTKPELTKQRKQMRDGPKLFSHVSRYNSLL